MIYAVKPTVRQEIKIEKSIQFLSVKLYRVAFDRASHGNWVYEPMGEFLQRWDYLTLQEDGDYYVLPYARWTVPS